MENDATHAPAPSILQSEGLMGVAANILARGLIPAPSRFSDRVRPGFPLRAGPPALDRDRRPPVPATDHREILRQNDHAERDHPEPKDGQESKQSADNQQDAQSDAHNPATRKADSFTADTKLGHADDLSRHTGGRPPARSLEMVELPEVG